VKQQHTSTVTSTQTTKSTYCSLSTQQLSECNVLLSLRIHCTLACKYKQDNMMATNTWIHGKLNKFKLLYITLNLIKWLLIFYLKRVFNPCNSKHGLHLNMYKLYNRCLYVINFCALYFFINFCALYFFINFFALYFFINFCALYFFINFCALYFFINFCALYVCAA
jgi:hypothetical protein